MINFIKEKVKWLAKKSRIRTRTSISNYFPLTKSTHLINGELEIFYL